MNVKCGAGSPPGDTQASHVELQWPPLASVVRFVWDVYNVYSSFILMKSLERREMLLGKCVAFTGNCFFSE